VCEIREALALESDAQGIDPQSSVSLALRDRVGLNGFEPRLVDLAQREPRQE